MVIIFVIELKKLKLKRNYLRMNPILFIFISKFWSLLTFDYYSQILQLGKNHFKTWFVMAFLNLPHKLHYYFEVPINNLNLGFSKKKSFPLFYSKEDKLLEMIVYLKVCYYHIILFLEVVGECSPHCLFFYMYLSLWTFHHVMWTSREQSSPYLFNTTQWWQIKVCDISPKKFNIFLCHVHFLDFIPFDVVILG